MPHGFVTIEDLLLDPEWESKITVDELRPDSWIRFAQLVKASKLFEGHQKTRMVARVQLLLVDAGKMTDEEFVSKLRGRA